MAERAAVGGELEEARRALAARDYATLRVSAARLVAAQPDLAEAWLLLANGAIGERDWAAAVPALERVHALAPQPALTRALAVALNNRGAALRRAGRAADAVRDFERALTLDPAQRDALLNRAEAHLDVRQPEAALALLERLPDDDAEALVARARAIALTADPAAADACLETLAAAEAAARLPARAAALARALLGEPARAIALPERELAGAGVTELTELGGALREAGANAAARRLFALARARGAPLSARIAEALSLPPVYRDLADLGAQRAAVEQGLRQLLEWLDASAAHGADARLEDLAFGFGRIAYQGREDLALARGWGRFVATVAARCEPALATPLRPPPRARPRIVLLSSGLRYCSTGCWFGRWAGALVEAGFELVAAQLGPGFDAVTDEIGAASSALLRLEGPLAAVATELRALAADLVLLPEIGADPRMAVLASLGLGARRIAAWGHPASTGLPGISHFLTVAAMEPDDGASHYSERLLPLPGLGVDYGWRPAPPPARDARALGLPAGRRYFLPHVALKWHPALDPVLVDLVRRDPEARLVGFRHDGLAAHRAVAARVAAALAAAGADPARHLHWLEPQPRARFLELAQACEVMLDSLGWSGGNASLDAFIAGLPVVTAPGALMRARQSHGMLRLMGLDAELAVADATGLAPRAVAIARDPARRAALSAAIGARLPLLFEARAARAALVEAVRAVLDAPASAT